MKQRDLRFYWKLFISTFYISAFTFGGGYVIIPLFKKKFSDEYQWIEEKEILDLVAIAQSSPGSIAVNASILIGYQLAGFLGALVAIVATVLPPLIILSVISLFYRAFKQSPAVNAVLRGMSAGVAAVIVDVVITMVKGVAQEKKLFSILVMILSFIAVFFFGVDVSVVILISGALGLLYFIHLRRKEKGAV